GAGLCSDGHVYRIAGRQLARPPGGRRRGYGRRGCRRVGADAGAVERHGGRHRRGVGGGGVGAMDPQILLIIVAMALVTYVPRMAPLVFLSGRSLPPVVMEWLGLLPAALLGALVAQAVLMPEGALRLSLDNPALI